MRFEVRMLDPNSGASTLRLDAVDTAAAENQVRQQGCAVLKIKPIDARTGWTWSESHSFPLGLFSQELLMLLEAGLSVVEAIETLKEKEGKAERQRLLAQIVTRLYQGQSLSQALEQFPAIFPPLYIATVRASERTGDLPESLGRYVTYQAQVDVVRTKVVSAAVYPLLLILVGMLVVAFLMGYVVPRFALIFEEIGGEIPFTSRMLIKWGSLVHGHGWALLLTAAAATAGGIFWLSRPATRHWLLERLTLVPAVGERLRMYQLARFYRTIGMLLRGGIPIMPSLHMTAELLQGSLRHLLSEAENRIREGMPISVAMESFGLTTPVSLRMLRVGERTGRMGEMMERIANFYDDEIARWVDWFVRLFEPILMAVIGVAIGAIVVMMYFPIFELAGSIQ